EILLQTSTVNTKALRAYTLSDHTIFWTYSGVMGIRTTPVIDSLNNIYVAEATTPRKVVCVDGQTGLAIWQTEIGANEYLTGCGALSMDQNTFFIASIGDEDVPSEGNLYAISTYDGSIRWTCNTKSAGSGSRRDERYICSVDSENKVYVTAQGNKDNVFPNPAMTPTISCVRDDGASGSLLWSFSLDDRPYRQAGGTSFSIGPDGTLFAALTLEPLQESDNLKSLYAFRDSTAPEIIDMQRNASENIEITWRSQYGVT
ncbi:unnamed protein product, partial [marine sediment metagenome]